MAMYGSREPTGDGGSGVGKRCREAEEVVCVSADLFVFGAWTS